MSLLMCSLCPNNCVIPESGRGKCRIRMNVNGELYTVTYGRPCAMHVDPVEKKPHFHFLPGTTAFSLATVGCCLDCKYCQNWQISQGYPEDAENYDMSPERIVEQALAQKCSSIAYTYTEPTVFFEYMVDISRCARKKGLRNLYITCGFINEKPLAELADVIDGANVDIKGFNDDFYQRVTGGRLEPVLNTVKYLYKRDVVVEITNLIVPTLNDTMDEIKKMCVWLVQEVSPDVPIHFSRFYPNYKLEHLPPTPLETLKEARDIALQVGLKYAYIGNVQEHEGQNTVCPKCGKIIVERVGYKILSYNMSKDRCSFCNERIYGHWRS
jgi:pyruvate formate lyase activating enzyme